MRKPRTVLPPTPKLSAPPPTPAPPRPLPSLPSAPTPLLVRRSEIGERPDFLPTLTEAPDLETAAQFAVSELALLARTTRGFISLIDAESESLVIAAQVGLAGQLDEVQAVALGELANPLAAVALGMQAAQGQFERPRAGIPMEQWVAFPLPRPLARGAPTPLSAPHAAELLTAWGLTLVATERKAGQVPAGVVVLDASRMPPAAISRLVQLSSLAGPALSVRAELDANRRAADRLRHERDRLMVMMNALPDPVMITDGANNVLVQNQRAEHLLAGREIDSAGRRRAVELNNLLFTSGLTRAMMTVGARTEPRELNLVDPDEGADLLFELLAHPLTGEVEADDAVLSVLRDVTDLRRAAHELQFQVRRVRQAEVEATKERDRLNLILENVADPILVTDPQAKIVLMNEQAEHLFEVGATAGTYDYFAQQTVLANDTKFTSFVSEFALSPEPSRRERMLLRHPRTARELPMEVVSGKIGNERGEPVAIVSVLHDLTQQVENERLYGELKAFSGQLEARVRAATADLEAQNEQLKWQSQELEKASKLKSDFLASMSHELRTPMNAIIGYAALILDGLYGDVTAKQADGLRRIRASAQDLLALINDILDLAKIEAGKMPLHVEPVQLRLVVSELAQQMQPMAEKRGLVLLTAIDEDTPLVETDRQKIKQVLANLLSNAVKFTSRGRVSLAVARAEDGVAITVQDTGIGIRREHLEVIWEDFRQVDQSKTREVGGTGLGLSIVRKLLQQLGGRASVESEYGVGSTFRVWIPLRIEGEREDA